MVNPWKTETIRGIKMKYFVEIDGIEKSVTLKREGDDASWLCAIDDQEPFKIDHQTALNSMHLLTRDANYAIQVSKASQDMMIRGSRHRFKVATPLMRAMDDANRGGAVANDGGLIVSPMPGRIVKTLVAEGAPVSAGQGVIVVEAMKMENELKSSTSGRIKRLHVSEGDLVEANAPLVEIVPEDTSNE